MGALGERKIAYLVMGHTWIKCARAERITRFFESTASKNMENKLRTQAGEHVRLWYDIEVIDIIHPLQHDPESAWDRPY